MKESRLVEMLEKQQQRKEIAREEAHKKLNSVNEQFTKKQGRVANAMAAAMQPFVGTVEDNIMCMALPHAQPFCQEPWQLTCRCLTSWRMNGVLCTAEVKASCAWIAVHAVIRM